jgi:ABC-type cobalamin/Fe3+-siderophores transport system ATPase subunit/ABC-type Fe3+-siderophore transport system permease subunit
LPRTLTAALAGAALGIAGLQMQTLFRNPLADPFALGVASGASLGVAVVVLGTGFGAAAMFGATLGLAGDAAIIAAAIVGAAVVLGIVLVVSARIESPTTVLILGLMFGYASAALVTVLVGATQPERLQMWAAWQFGSFSGVTWQRLRLFLPLVAAGIVLAGLTTKELDALLLGEDYARSMGVPVRRARTLTMLCASVLGAVVTAFCGPISFLGIAVPHLCRGLLRTSDHRVLVPAVILMGGSVALAAPDRLALARKRRDHPAERRPLARRRAGRGQRAAARAALGTAGVTASAGRAVARVLRASGLAVGYGHRRTRRAVLSGLELELSAGELVCLLGRNGIGKSTLLRTLARMQPPLAGSVEVGGEDLRRLSQTELARRIAVVLTDRPLVGSLSARRVVERGRYPHSNWLGRMSERDAAVVDRAIELAGVGPLAARDFTHLSDGERQRVMIARALAQEPRLLVLDEPTAFLDAPSRVEVVALLRRLAREEDLSVLLSSHDVELSLRAADRIWLVASDGRIHSGAPEDLVLAGDVARAFDSSGVSFQADQRTFRLSEAWRGARGAAVVEGEGLLAQLAAAVLEREGYDVATGVDAAAGITLHIETALARGDGPRWHVSGGDVLVHGETFAALAACLRSLPPGRRG